MTEGENKCHKFWKKNHPIRTVRKKEELNLTTDILQRKPVMDKKNMTQWDIKTENTERVEQTHLE